MPDTTESEAPKKMSIREIRENAVMLNTKLKENPEASVTPFQLAITSLIVELCDRVTDLGIETGKWFERLDGQDQECIRAVQDVAGKVGGEPPSVGGTPTTPAGPLTPEQQAAAEIAALPSAVQNAPTKVAPTNGEAAVPADAAAMAASLSGTAGIPTPTVMSVKKH